jgi:hypothetical protein
MIKVHITFILEFRLLSYSKIPTGYENMTQNLHCEHPPSLPEIGYPIPCLSNRTYISKICVLCMEGVTLRERKTTWNSC